MTPPPIDRRTVLAGGIATALAPSAARAVPSRGSTPGVAITIDDFDLTDTPLMTGTERDIAIRRALARHGVKGAGFPAGKFVDNPDGTRVLGAWSGDGHIIGNHSYAHRYFGGGDPPALMADIARCEAVLAHHAGFRRLFRFPFLAEGKTAEGRDAMRRLLRANRYRNAHVTIDTSDWYIDNRMVARLKTDPRADVSGYRRYWLEHVWDRATFYDALARDVFGRPIDHTVLLHHRLATGLFLDDLLTLFRRRGWRLIDAETAFASPPFALDPDTLPAGQSLVWAATKARGGFDDRLRYPGEDGDYEAARMDALGL